MDKKISVTQVIFISTLVIAPVFYFVFNPSEHSWMPQCVFHKITGLQCMGCGAQRMAHHLLHGEFREAMEANMFLFFSLPVMIFWIYCEVTRKKHPRLYRKLHGMPAIITVSVMLFSWLILRNLIGI